MVNTHLYFNNEHFNFMQVETEDVTVVEWYIYVNMIKIENWM